MTDANKLKTPAPSSDSQSGGKNTTPPPTVATGPKESPVDTELNSRDPSTDHTELGISDSHAVSQLSNSQPGEGSAATHPNDTTSPGSTGPEISPVDDEMFAVSSGAKKGR